MDSYTYKSISNISIDDQDLAKMFLIKKTPAEVKAFDEAMKKLPATIRNQTADPSVDARAIFDEMERIVHETPDEYSNLYNLPNVDYMLIVQKLLRQYKLITRNPRLYKINLKSFLKCYDSLIAENWEAFDRERVALEKKALAEGRERTMSPASNVCIFNRLSNLIASIDLNKIKNNDLTYEV